MVSSSVQDDVTFLPSAKHYARVSVVSAVASLHCDRELQAAAKNITGF